MPVSTMAWSPVRRRVLSFRAIIDPMPDAANPRSRPPKFTQPQLPLLVKTPPSGPGTVEHQKSGTVDNDFRGKYLRNDGHSVEGPRTMRFRSPLVLSRVHWVRPELSSFDLLVCCYYH
jgi:hypothetical protein